MGTFRKTMSILVLVFFVVSLTAASASAGYWNSGYKDKCGCGYERNHCGCGYERDHCGCCYEEDDCDFDFLAFFGSNFFGTGWNCVDNWDGADNWDGVDGWDGFEGLWN